MFEGSPLPPRVLKRAEFKAKQKSLRRLPRNDAFDPDVHFSWRMRTTTSKVEDLYSLEKQAPETPDWAAEARSKISSYLVSSASAAAAKRKEKLFVRPRFGLVRTPFGRSGQPTYRQFSEGFDPRALRPATATAAAESSSAAALGKGKDGLSPAASQLLGHKLDALFTDVRSTIPSGASPNFVRFQPKPKPPPPDAANVSELPISKDPPWIGRGVTIDNGASRSELVDPKKIASMPSSQILFDRWPAKHHRSATPKLGAPGQRIKLHAQLYPRVFANAKPKATSQIEPGKYSTNVHQPWIKKSRGTHFG